MIVWYYDWCNGPIDRDVRNDEETSEDSNSERMVRW